jgi:hypothetical protein
MAGNKKRSGLDQPAGNTLTGIDRLLAEFASQAIEADEFTIAMVRTRTPGSTDDQIRSRIDRLVDKGACTVRSVIVGGRLTNAYRYVSE